MSRYGRWARTQLPRIKRPRLPRPSAHTWAIIIKVVAAVGAIALFYLLFSIQANTNMLAKQAKNTADVNQRIAKANGRHIDCIAGLFAQYTRDQKPIAKADLDKCQITEAEAAGIVGAGLFSGAVDFTPSSTSEAPVPAKNTRPNNNTNTPTNSNQNPPNQPPTPTPKAPEPARVLGVPVCVPDPLSLINGGVCVTH